MADYGSHRIVVGFDGSSDSLAALDWAIAEGRLRDLAVVAYHVWHWPHSHNLEAERVLTAAGEQILDAGMAHGAGHGADVKLSCELARGGPAQQLVRASNEADLLVVGARGQGGFPGLRAGSVSVQVARHAHCSVVVTHDDTANDTGGSTDGRIVVGVDGSPGADVAVRFAFAEATRRRAPLHAMYAWDPESPLASAYASDLGLDQLHEEADRKLDAWLRPHAIRYPDVKVSRLLVRGGSGSALLDAATSAALLVAGTRGHGGFSTMLFGSTSDTVLHHASCATAFVR
jgi:nucleotide-binding universal stress UspA family protein